MGVQHGAAPALAHILSILALGAMAGCRGDDRAQAMSDIRHEIEGARVCAMLLSASWPVDGYRDAFATPQIDALVAAGLIQRVRLSGSGMFTRFRIDITKTGRRDIRIDDADTLQPSAFLCFGRRRVIRMQHVMDSDGAGKVRYAYRIVDTPGWTARPDMRTNFPFMARLLDHEHTVENGTWREHGRWGSAGGAEYQILDQMGSKGFFACEDMKTNPDSPCR